MSVANYSRWIFATWKLISFRFSAKIFRLKKIYYKAVNIIEQISILISHRNGFWEKNSHLEFASMVQFTNLRKINAVNDGWRENNLKLKKSKFATEILVMKVTLKTISFLCRVQIVTFHIWEISYISYPWNGQTNNIEVKNS